MTKYISRRLFDHLSTETSKAPSGGGRASAAGAVFLPVALAI